MPTRFVEIAKAEVTDTRHLVISKNIDGKISIAQKMIFNAEGREQYMFMKNSIITDKEGLEKIKEAVDCAIKWLDDNETVK